MLKLDMSLNQVSAGTTKKASSFVAKAEQTIHDNFLQGRVYFVGKAFQF